MSLFSCPFPLRVLFRTMTSFAVFHMLYLAVFAVLHGDYSLISLFSVLDFGMISPGLEKGALSFVAGVGVIALVYGVWFVLMRGDDRACS